MKSQDDDIKAGSLPWEISDITIVMIIGLVLVYGLVLLMNLIGASNVFTENKNYSGIYVLIALLFQNIAFLIPMLLIGSHNKKLSWHDFGFRKVSFKKLVGYTFLGYISYFFINLLIQIAQILSKFEIPGFGIQENRLEMFGTGTFNQAMSFIAIVILAPVLEEVFFRGFLFQTLKAHTKPWLAIILGGFIFAALHIELQVILPLWLLGIILCYIFHKTNSIYTSITFHILNNLIAFLITVFLS